jgi:hypothetical protein
LERVLDVGELLIEFPEPDLHLFEIVRKGLDLSGHRIQARAGVGLNVLNGLLQVAHDVVQAADGGRVLVEKSLDRGVFLVERAANVLLALKQRGNVALELDDFTRYRPDWGGKTSGFPARLRETRRQKTKWFACAKRVLLLRASDGQSIADGPGPSRLRGSVSLQRDGPASYCATADFIGP